MVIVDVIMLVGSETERVELPTSLRKKLLVKDLGVCTWFDGCVTERDVLEATTLSQKSYVEALINRFNVTTTSNIPATRGANLRPKEDDQPGVD